ncbi:MAG: sugar ABC transporter permease [Chloroflexota bacterium]|nr:MAG: sugar ABC transporter permease [Chloroflexota bacterium]
MFSPTREFVGLNNYLSVLASGEFWLSMNNTLYYAVGVVGLELTAALALALLLNRPLRGLSLYRTAFFAPVVTSTVAVSIVWLWLFDPQTGLFNYILSLLGLPESGWLTDPTMAMPAIILMSTWHQAGYYMVIYLAGLQAIPREFYDAAKVDGAGRWTLFRHITWPLLTPTTLFVLIIGMIGALQAFDAFYVMTQGGPLKATQTMVFYLYQVGFKFYEIGAASAMAYLLFVVIFTLTIIQWKVVGRLVDF